MAQTATNGPSFGGNKSSQRFKQENNLSMVNTIGMLIILNIPEHLAPGANKDQLTDFRKNANAFERENHMLIVSNIANSCFGYF